VALASEVGIHTALYPLRKTQVLNEPFIQLIILSLATFRFSRLLTTDVIFDDLRQRLWKRYSPLTKLGYLFTCNWCMSVWVASLLTICYTIVPTATVVVALPFALSAVAGIITSRYDH
jgi:hypothetical protein